MVPEAGVALLAALLLGGCGHHAGSPAARASRGPVAPGRPRAGREPAHVCRPGAERALARLAGVAAPSVRAREQVASDGDPTCRMLVPGGPRVTVDLNRDPQAFFVLERTIEENAQLTSFIPSHPGPQHIDHLGLDAAWFPDADYLLTSDGVTLVKATVGWSRVPDARRRALARAVARWFLGPLHPGAADPPGS